jgi:hypothetical protein
VALVSIGFAIDRRTVNRHLTRLGLGERRFTDPGRKKDGRIRDGGGWRIHGWDSLQAKVAGRAKSAGAWRGRLAYTEPLGDEKDATAAAFLARTKVWFAADGVNHIHRVVTDNGACYRYTLRHNGKVKRYQRIEAEKVLYARGFTNEEARSAAIAVWNIHYNYRQPHRAAAGKPPAVRLRESVTNVEPSYTLCSPGRDPN